MVSQGNGLLEETKSSKEQLEKNIEILSSNNTKMEDKLKASSEEIKKGNAIISKLQSDLKAMKNKLKNKASVVQSQEAVIVNHYGTIEELKRKNHEIVRDIELKSHEISSMENTISDLKDKLKSGDNALTESQNMIGYLNNKINQMGANGLATIGSVTMRSQSPMMGF